jgi:tripartite-type tricarboxylate transporter receptor subunit TctC
VSRIGKVAVLAAALVLGLGASQAAETNPLSGRTIEFLVTGQPGDGYDISGRLFASYLEAKLGEGTEVVMRNVHDGGGLLAVQQLYAADPDGNTIAMIISGFLLDQMLSDEPPAFDLTAATWLGKLTDSTRVLVAGPAAGYQDLAGLLAATGPQTLSANRVNSTATYDALLVNALLGTHIQPVYGYDTSSKVMALLSGEIALTSGTASSLFGVMDSPDVKVLLFTTKGSEAPRFGDVPSLAELAPPEGRRILDFFDTVHLYGRLILGPPGMPPDIVQAWREVFLAVVNDPAFIAEAKTLGLELAPLPGSEVAEAIGRLFADVEGLRVELNRAIACGRARGEGREDGC